MPEIHLPTKAMQDLIKQDTENILSYFPLDISGGTDFTKLNYAGTTVEKHYSNLVININGSGFLHYLYLFHGGSFSVQIDNGEIYEIEVNSGISLMINFKSNLKVYKSQTNSHWIGYLLY